MTSLYNRCPCEKCKAADDEYIQFLKDKAAKEERLGYRVCICCDNEVYKDKFCKACYAKSILQPV